MRHALFLCLLWPSVACGQVVRAQLLDFTPDKLGAYCGYQRDATLLLFRVVDTQGPRAVGDSVLVAFPCAREAAAHFKNGVTYTLKLHEMETDPEWQKGWHLSSTYEHLAFSRWWCQGWMPGK
jgi:hypothetical protein